jgi:chemotaxis protein methyltransferase CheR
MESDSLDPKTFKKFCSLIYERAGIKLGPQKEALVSARVGKRMRTMGITQFDVYYRYVESDNSGNEMVELLNAISTNVTHFFREERHFDLLAKLTSQWEKEGQTRFRIWSCAASTGEEPYSIAMTLEESLRNSADVRILATDISTKVLGIAKEGLYEKRHVETVDDGLLRKYFFRERTDGTEKYRVADPLKKLVTFARLNLAEPPFPMKGPFDVIFCRNVMIYFDNAVRRPLLADCYRLLKKGGYLMVGHAESLSGMLSDFKSIEPSVYIKR